MSKVLWIPMLGLVGLLAAASSARGQAAPYAGFVYPAGGQQGTTVQVKLGGQRLVEVHGAVVSGQGVSAKLARYDRKLSNQEVSLLREQLKELRREAAQNAQARNAQVKNAQVKNAQVKNAQVKNAQSRNKARQELIARIQKRMAEFVNRPACAALCEIAYVDVTIPPDTEPGAREIRLLTSRGVTNPLVFHVGQLPEFAREPMKTSLAQVLGKEHLALRKRPEEEVEERITVPCTINGQIASGEVNRYRLEASIGQRLIISVMARELIPYIADAVPGWFQPVVTVYDAQGKEVAFNDDYRFKPDPTLCFEVPEDGEYVLVINDAIYRGREDFVYRITIGEVPFITSVFPLGGRAGEPVHLEMDGWNLQGAKLTLPADGSAPGTYLVTAKQGRLVSNPVPFVLDTLPECLDQEPNNDPAHAQELQLPMIVNGRIDQTDDWDVFRVEGRAGDTLVAEVHARRLDSPLDSMLKVTDEDGKLLGLNDDHADPAVGLNTHHADSYITVELPADGIYYVHLGDTARNGGGEFGYRLRIGPPRPDFELRVTPSGGGLRKKGARPVTVYAIRKDGFDGAIRLMLKDPPNGFSSPTVWLPKGKQSAKLAVRTSQAKASEPVDLVIEGRATIAGQAVVHEATPAEDRMQAFLWRHLVPAKTLTVQVFDPAYKPQAKRTLPPPPATPQAVAGTGGKQIPRQFTERQVANRLRQLKGLYQEWLLTAKFYNRKVAECEAAL